MRSPCSWALDCRSKARCDRAAVVRSAPRGKEIVQQRRAQCDAVAGVDRSTRAGDLRHDHHEVSADVVSRADITEWGRSRGGAGYAELGITRASF